MTHIERKQMTQPTTPRHDKLLKLYEDVNLLLLGQSNREYIKELTKIKNATLVELRKEQKSLGMIK